MDAVLVAGVDQATVGVNLSHLVAGTLLPLSLLVDDVAALREVGQTEVSVAVREALDRRD